MFIGIHLRRGKAAMQIFQCFFYCDSVIANWENIECTESSLPEILRSALEENGWEYAEAWLDDRLFLQIEENRCGAGAAEAKWTFAAPNLLFNGQS